MPRQYELSVPERSQIILLHRQGVSLKNIAKQMKRSRCAVRHTIQRFQESGTYVNRSKSGRKRITTAREDRYLERLALRDRRKSSKDLATDLWQQQNISVSTRTIRRRLVEVNLHGRKARRKPLLNERHKKARLLWAKNHQDWTPEQWAKVIWSDESNIEVWIVTSLSIFFV